MNNDVNNNDLNNTNTMESDMNNNVSEPVETDNTIDNGTNETVVEENVNNNPEPTTVEDNVVEPVIVQSNSITVHKKRRVRNIILTIINIFIVALVIYFVIGYFNFFKITKNQDPVLAGTKTEYEKNGGQVVVHDYKVYKIVKYTVPGKNITYSLKLWFMDDVK